MEAPIDWIQLKQLERLAMTKQLDSIIEVIQDRNKKIKNIYASAKEAYEIAVLQSAPADVIQALEKHLLACKQLFASAPAAAAAAGTSSCV